MECFKVGFTKDVIEKGDDYYLNFKAENAEMTYDIIGKHLTEFIKDDIMIVPEFFILIKSFFEAYPHLYATEGIFRITSSLDKIDEL
jgi:hypothetical protein